MNAASPNVPKGVRFDAPIELLRRNPLPVRDPDEVRRLVEMIRKRRVPRRRASR